MERDFKGVWIPKEIWLDERLTALEKIILIEIDSLDNEDKHCFASNGYLAEFCQCSEVKVSNAISKLIKLGYIEQVSFDGRIRVLKSRVTKSEGQTYKNYEADSQKVEANNKENIIDNKINDIRKRQKPFTPPSLQEIEDFCKERNNKVDAKRVYDYYNSAGWKDSRGNPIKSWKQKIIAVWEKPEQQKPSIGKVAHEAKEYETEFNEDGTFKWD